MDTGGVGERVVAPTTTAQGAPPGDHRTLRPSTPFALHSHARLGIWRRPTDRQLDLRIAGSDCDLWLALRVPKEERMLIEEFGEEY